MLVSVLLTLSASATCAAASALRSLFIKLQTGVEQRRQRALTGGKECVAAYSRACKVELVMSASATCAAPSFLSSLPTKLSKGAEWGRQPATDRRETVCGDIQEPLEGLIDCEGV